MKKGERSVAVGTVVTIATHNEHDCISMSEMVRSFEGEGTLTEQWLKAKDTMICFGGWEQLNSRENGVAAPARVLIGTSRAKRVHETFAARS